MVILLVFRKIKIFYYIVIIFLLALKTYVLILTKLYFSKL